MLARNAEEVECRSLLPFGPDPVAPPTLCSIDSIMEALSHDQRYINIGTAKCCLEFNRNDLCQTGFFFSVLLLQKDFLEKNSLI